MSAETQIAFKVHSTCFRDSLARYPEHSSYSNMLVGSLVRTREKVIQISSRIPYYNGELTVHDITHIDALWEMVDLLLYHNVQQFHALEINPLELFLLGTAILIHDVGLSAISLSQGIGQLKRYDDFQPTLRSLLREKNRREPTHDDLLNYDLAKDGIKDGLVGALLRSNHAAVVSDIVVNGWRTQDGGQINLIEDDELREDWAHIIGKIARSHNEEIKAIRELPELESVRAGHSISWMARPQFIACILRCADALQLDHRRAPKLICRFTNFTAQSAAHWKAQSRVRRITSDQHLIRVFSDELSTDEAEIWWQGYELFCNAQHELDMVDTFLRQNNYPRFCRRRIIGIESPENFVRYFRLNGAFPFRPEVKIGVPTEVIARLGGNQLYGHEKNIPIRELLMNARDAIVIRQNSEGDAFRGQIKAALYKEDGDNFLEICDNGVGMDKYTLSEILLDFGNSFWSKEEKWTDSSIGTYGIGFFSVFMWCDFVRVVSRRPGSARVAGLTFKEGLRGRPEFRDYDCAELDEWISTKILLRLKSENVIRELCEKPLGEVVLGRGFSVKDVFFGLLPITSIDIELNIFGECTIISGAAISILDGYCLQRRLRFGGYIERDVGQASHQPFIVFSQHIFNKDGEVLGLGWPANVGDGSGRLRSVVTVKGFPTLSHFEDFAGVVEGRSTSVSRAEYKPIAGDEALRDWFARCQAKMVTNEYPMDYVWARWAFRLKVDPSYSKFISFFSRDPEEEAYMSVEEMLQRNVEFLQVNRSSRFFRFLISIKRKDSRSLSV